MKLVTTFLVVLMATLSSFAQSDSSYWSDSNAKVDDPRELKINPTRSSYFALDKAAIWSDLQAAGDRHDVNAVTATVQIPTVDGIKSFRVFEASDMDPALQARFQNIRSYAGTSSDGSGDRIRLTWTPYGFHALIQSFKNGLQFIDPVDKSGTIHMLYKKSDLSGRVGGTSCEIVDKAISTNDFTTGVEDANDSELRTYRMAISTTIEYSRFSYIQAGFTDASPDVDRRDAVMAAIAVTLARVNFIYERDLAVQLLLVPNNNLIVFLDTDNFSNSNPGALLGENQSVIDATIGSANYDIGHIFTTGGGGVASLGGVCNPTRKAQGVTGSPTPVGDPYDIDFVSHEVGHQFGALHSYNGTGGACGGQRSGSTAYEVGSGTTIMAYAGICPPQNVQPNSDAYFHRTSLDEIRTFLNGGGRCSNELPIANDPPTANAGADVFIPALTPYRLTGSSTDPQGTTLHTYTWEQFDLGTAGLPSETSTTGPLVRSREGDRSPTRYIPQLSDVVANGGTSTEWEGPIICYTLYNL